MICTVAILTTLSNVDKNLPHIASYVLRNVGSVDHNHQVRTGGYASEHRPKRQRLAALRAVAIP